MQSFDLPPANLGEAPAGPLDEFALNAHGTTMRIGNRILAAILLASSTAAWAADEQPICPDRPSKSTGPCTVPKGKFQIETGLVDWTHDESSGVRTDLAVWGSSGLKYGISQNADIELWLMPLETLSMHSGGISEHHSGIGDTLVRMKYEITKNDAPVQVALDPFVKIPTANHQLGNGKFEAGLLVPVQIALGKSPFTLSLDPELDWLANQSGNGRHLAMVQLVNLGWQASKKLTFTTEIWSQWDWDPSGITRQRSWDGSVAYLLNKDVQVDAGANFGLTHQTPDLELYTGVSVRF